VPSREPTLPNELRELLAAPAFRLPVGLPNQRGAPHDFLRYVSIIGGHIDRQVVPGGVDAHLHVLEGERAIGMLRMSGLVVARYYG
jgi:hypothetical protein